MDDHTIGPDDDLVESAPFEATTHEGHDDVPSVAPVPPTTGDAEIDAVLRELADAEEGSLAERIAVGERTHRALRDRLTDLGGP